MTPPKSSSKWRRFFFVVSVYTLLALCFIFFLTPIVWGLFSSFHLIESLSPKRLIELIKPENFTLEHYLYFLRDPNLLHYLKNSFLIAGLSSFCTVALASLGGYGLSRFVLPGREAILTTVFSSRMFPFVLILIPVYFVFYGLRLVDTFLGVILAHIAISIPFTLWIAKAYFDKIPKELEEAALLDGCSRLGALWRVILPLAAPGIIVIAFYAFMISWGDYLMISLLASSSKVATLPFGLAALKGRSEMWGAILAMTSFSVTPPILLFAFINRWFITGLSTGALK